MLSKFLEVYYILNRVSIKYMQTHSIRSMIVHVASFHLEFVGPTTQFSNENLPQAQSRLRACLILNVPQLDQNLGYVPGCTRQQFKHTLRICKWKLKRSLLIDKYVWKFKLAYQLYSGLINVQHQQEHDPESKYYGGSHTAPSILKGC